MYASWRRKRSTESSYSWQLSNSEYGRVFSSPLYPPGDKRQKGHKPRLGQKC